jgi:hypothetical protein
MKRGAPISNLGISPLHINLRYHFVGKDEEARDLISELEMEMQQDHWDVGRIKVLLHAVRTQSQLQQEHSRESWDPIGTQKLEMDRNWRVCAGRRGASNADKLGLSRIGRDGGNPGSAFQYRCLIAPCLRCGSFHTLGRRFAIGIIVICSAGRADP